MIHWTWILFTVISLILIIWLIVISRNTEEDYGAIGGAFHFLLWFIVVIIFISVWGAIFWW